MIISFTKFGFFRMVSEDVSLTELKVFLIAGMMSALPFSKSSKKERKESSHISNPYFPYYAMVEICRSKRMEKKENKRIS